MALDLELSNEFENVNASTMIELDNIIAPTMIELDNIISPAMMEPNSIIETTQPCCRNEDEEVDITGFTISGRASIAQDTYGDETDYSSSFGDTGSEAENASLSDPEVESRICADTASSSMSDACHKSFQRREKCMTAHWRKFIRPIEWRCKWIELKLKQLQSLEEKYEKELAAYSHTKEIDMAHLTLDGSSIKSVPISGRVRKNKVMKRNKRRKVEEECDLASYMSHNNLFSYYNDKADCVNDARLKDSRDVALGGNDGNMVEFESNDLWTSDKNDSTDKSMVEIIEKLEAAQSQLQNLKTRLDKVLIMDVDLRENQVAEEELHDLDIVGNKSVKKTNESIEDNKAISQVQVPAPDSSENAVHKKHPSFRKCYISNKFIPKNKRTAMKKPSDQMRRNGEIFG